MSGSISHTWGRYIFFQRREGPTHYVIRHQPIYGNNYIITVEPTFTMVHTSSCIAAPISNLRRSADRRPMFQRRNGIPMVMTEFGEM